MRADAIIITQNDNEIRQCVIGVMNFSGFMTEHFYFVLDNNIKALTIQFRSSEIYRIRISKANRCNHKETCKLIKQYKQIIRTY